MKRMGGSRGLLASATFAGGLAALLGSCAGDDPPARGAPATPGTDAQAQPEAGIGADADGSAIAPLCSMPLQGPTHGSAIGRSADGKVLVVVGRDYEGSVAILRARDDSLIRFHDPVRLSIDGEPMQVVVDACGDRAWVIQRKFQTIVELVGLKDAEPRVGRQVSVGSEPTGFAVSPNYRFLYVANWVDGTLSVVDARSSDLQVVQIIDLNAALVGTGWLGSAQRVGPGLAHPRSVAITNDGDGEDLDETVYVTEFFSQRVSRQDENGRNGDGTTADTNRNGLVYAVSVADGSVKTIPLPALKSTGFTNAAGEEAGCFPNQVQSIGIEGHLAYVTSICASPFGSAAMYTRSGTCAVDSDCGVGAHQGACRGGACEPIASNVKSSTFPVIHVIDTRTNSELPGARVNLNRFFRDLYDSQGVPDDASRRFPLVANEIAFVPDASGTAFVSANGADALFRLQFDRESGMLAAVAGPDGAAHYADLRLAQYDLDENLRGVGPIGVTLSGDGSLAYVANDISRNLSIVDTRTMSVVVDSDSSQPAVIQTAPLPDQAGLIALRGRGLFNSGLGRWSYRGQAWIACQSCHFEGLSDNVTWHLTRGPRQSVSLDGSFASGEPHDQRIFNWTAVFDEITDFEKIIRQLQGGQGAIDVPAAGDLLGLDGSSAGLSAVPDDWEAVRTWLQTIRSPRAPRYLVREEVDRGRELFLAAGCGGCHGGPKWTLSTRFYEPDRPTSSPSVTTRLFDTPYDGAGLTVRGFPSALLPAPKGSQFMRSPPPDDPRFLDLDQIQCVLRPVGTYGVSPPEVGVAEKRGDMTTAAQGDELIGKGYNVPSLLGLSVGAPYFHAGNARSLEELLSDVFATHRNALAKDAALLDDPGNLQALVSFLLSIDELTPLVPLPAVAGAEGGDFCEPPPPL